MNYDYSINKILFLTYLTNYNIDQIYLGLKSDDFSLFIEMIIISKNTIKNSFSDSDVYKAESVAITRHDEMIYNKIILLSCLDPKYPEGFKQINQPPPIIFIKGMLGNTKNCAVVGSRKISHHAFETVNNVVSTFVNENFGIISGNALGIDSIVHSKAIHAKGYTIAVIGTSLESVYPKENLNLANSIIESGGALISELAFGIRKGKMGFIARNRLQSAMSDFIIPIEMNVNSGTLHTVNFCKQQNKYLVIIAPNAEKQILPEYKGINYLMKTNYKNKLIVQEGFGFDDITEGIKKLLKS